MRKVLALVEGQTEEQFVKRVLNPYTQQLNDTYIIPIIVTTKRMGSQPAFKGGFVSYEKFKKQVRYLLNDSSALLVTTMIDYYALGEDFPGMEANPGHTGLEKVQYIEEQVLTDINHQKFVPYIQLHEYEALLYTDTKKIVDKFFISSDHNYAKILNKIDEVWRTCTCPEEINTGQETHPSARILDAIPAYKKIADGPQIAETIGVPAIQSKCDHFACWAQSILR